MVHASGVGVAGLWRYRYCGCSSVVEHLLAKERVESSNLFIRLTYLMLSQHHRCLISAYLEVHFLVK